MNVNEHAHIYHSVGGVMSKTSKADYAVYTLGRPGQTKVVAIIDAKKHITPHSVAQVIGYYSAFEVGDPRPLVVVLTAYELKIVIFPFHDGSQRLVNAVELQEFKLWKGEGRMLDVGMLNLLLSLMDEKSKLRNYSVEAKKANIPQEARIPKNRVCTIVTDQAKFEEISKNLSALNRMVRQLKEDRVKWLREQKQQQRELKKMRKLKKQKDLEMRKLKKQKDLEMRKLKKQNLEMRKLEKQNLEMRKLEKQKDLEMRKLKKQNLEMRKLEKQNLEMRKLEKELKDLKDQNESKRCKRWWRHYIAKQN